ncbi:hypothetical protein [Paenibacillus harenae]|uniref:hypothetical protein n=1 Tax=Paenibacillus harenae TaxID=306543 RepID=UPI0003FC4E67|nr:hypothetical protein [Paenibacillus harenae]
MSEWSEAYRYGLCQPSELSELEQFLHRHWKEDHPLAVHRPLMDWQHLNNDADGYHFLIARHRGSDEIHAVIGFIPVSQFDSSLPPYRDIWLAIWKVREDAAAPGLGLTLLFCLLERFRPRTLAAIGISPVARSIYRMLGYRLGVLSQYYILHPNKTLFQLVGGSPAPLQPHADAESGGDKQFIRRGSGQFRQLTARLADTIPPLHERIPSKSPHYWIKRYYEHPVYDYETYTIHSKSNPDQLAWFTFRQARHAGANALRIVDYYGDPSMLAGARACFEQLLEHYDAEYIDFYVYGLQEETLAAAGFRVNEPDSGLIIPNYYEPFEQRNVRIDFACKADSDQAYFITKGDSDQDRPNLIQGERDE